LVEAILDAAKASDRVLRDDEILSVILEQISPVPQGGVSA